MTHDRARKQSALRHAGLRMTPSHAARTADGWSCALRLARHHRRELPTGRPCVPPKLLADLIAVEAKVMKATADLQAMVEAWVSRLMQIAGVGPVGAARLLADVGDLSRFADRNRFASWTATAPLDAPSAQ